MRRVRIALFSALMIVSLTATIAFAGNVRISGLGFSLGSLIADGTLLGLGNEDVTFVLDAAGIPEVTCTNHGGNQAPGQNPPKVSASGVQFLVHENYTQNGRSLFDVETEEPQPGFTAEQLGCPNNHWTATIDFVFWTEATITVKSTATQAILLQKNFTCETTHTSVTCTETP